MKKRQIWILWIAIGQAVAILTKEKKLRDDIQATPGVLGKLKLLGEKRLHTNKTLINEVASVDREKTGTSIEADVNHDVKNAKGRIDEQKNKDREAEGRDAVRNIKGKLPTEDDVKKKVDTYGNQLKKWWDSL